MKQGKLIRRAVSAALAGCMMFTFSAPALAESTDALMQLSMTRRSAVSVLDAENSGTDANASVATKYGITIEIYGRGKVKVDSSNCDNILGFLKYDPDEQKLTLLKSNASAVNYLTIDAPNTDVVLESTEMIVSNNLLIENARSVKVSSTGNWAPVYGKVYIYCLCPVTLEHTEAGANSGVAIKGIEFAAPVSANDFVYYTSNAPDATPTDAGTGTIPARTKNYLRIVPKVSYTITADGATITVDGKAVNSAFAGEKVTVTAAGRENAEFTGWTAEGITLTKEQKANPTVNFTMPDKNVTLNPNYNVVQDYGLEVGSENTTLTRVTSKNHQDILGNGVLSYDPTTQTLKSDGRIKRSSLKINAPGKDINLDGKDQIAVAAKLIVENTCISGYRKRTPHFRLLPMVKCPLDCFLVYSFLLDVEQAKIRHAPFGTFAFSDKPLRNPSEHSDFWYIQGRIFSSCGLSETQGLPRSLVRFRAHRGDRSRKAHKWLYFPL